MDRFKALLKNLAALLAGIVFAFVVAEAALRIYNPFDFRVKGDNIVLPANKKYVITKRRSKIQHSKLDRIITHTKNSLGFRGEEPPENPSRFLKIITVGGSTTECTFLSDEKTWTDVLAKKLQEDIKHLWVNNAGFDGQSTFGHIILMNDYIVKLEPDIVLFLVGANDQDRDDLSDQDMEIMRTRFSFHSVKSFLKSLANHSEVVSLGLNVFRYWKSVNIGVDHAELNFHLYKDVDHDKYTTAEFIKMKNQTLDAVRTTYAQDFEKRLKKLADISRENNIEPVFITQPAFYGDFIDDVTNVDFGFTEISWELLEIYNDVIRNFGEKNSVLVIDLARAMPKSSRYYYDWLHYSNEGAEKVAEIIYNTLYPHLAENYAEYLQ